MEYTCQSILDSVTCHISQQTTTKNSNANKNKITSAAVRLGFKNPKVIKSKGYEIIYIYVNKLIIYMKFARTKQAF